MDGSPKFRNVLFVLDGDMCRGGGSQVYRLARELSSLGFDCVVAIPARNPARDEDPGGERSGPCFERVLLYEELYEDLEKGRSAFPDGRGPDIVHAWTPREIVRRYCQRLSRRHNFRQFVHMENHEWHMLARHARRPWNEIEALPLEQLDGLVPEGFSHPVRGLGFMKESTGITLATGRLSEIVPSQVPTWVLCPSAEPDLFFPRPLPKLDGSSLGIPSGACVIVYSGSVRPGNANQVRGLYLAVAILNREGFPVTLVRTGENHCDFLGADDRWAKPHVIDLGVVPRYALPPVMALADLFVQPGKPGLSNHFRVPSKLPEFFSIGRPVILPASNIALSLEHGRHAWVLEEANALNIAGAVRTIMGKPALYATLAAGASQFFEARLNPSRAARDLAGFYSLAMN